MILTQTYYLMPSEFDPAVEAERFGPLLYLLLGSENSEIRYRANNILIAMNNSWQGLAGIDA